MIGFLRELLGVLLPTNDEWGALGEADVGEYVGRSYTDAHQLRSIALRLASFDEKIALPPVGARHQAHK